MFEKILIANRSEVAARIARTCKRLGVTTVAIHTDADADAVHVQACDEAVRLDATDLASSYLSASAIVAAAQRAGADAVHPGYGLAANDVALARAVIAAGMTFIGPSPEAIELAADRARVRALCAKAEVRAVAGMSDPIDTLRAAYQATEALGYPVVVKPLVPRDAMGVRFADDDEELEEAFEGARAAGRELSGDERVVIERAIERPRVVEIEVLADAGAEAEGAAGAEAEGAAGSASESESVSESESESESVSESVSESARLASEETPPPGISAAAETAARAAAERGAAEIVAIGDRECSAQRKLRRIVSESPAAAVNGLPNGDFVREALNEAAVRIVRAARVVGSATVRFLLDADGRYHALGLAVGLSVDHALHEMCTGLDLVEMQIRIAAGESMPPEVLSASTTGHAMEAHLVWDVQGAAPDGELTELRFPPVPSSKARIETGLAQGARVVPGYDALVAKVTAFGPTRHQAALALDRVIAETVVAPFTTNAPLVRRVLGHEAFRAGQYDATFVERMIQQRI